MKLPSKYPAQNIFTQYCEAYNRRDMNAIMGFFMPESQLWGTGKDEYRIGLEAILAQHERDFSQSTASKIHVISFISTPLEANWAAGICQAHITVEGENYVFDDLRGTIIVKDGKILHMHASFPDPRNASEGSFPVG